MNEKVLIALILIVFFFSSWWSSRHHRSAVEFYEQQLRERDNTIAQLRERAAAAFDARPGLSAHRHPENPPAAHPAAGRQKDRPDTTADCDTADIRTSCVSPVLRDKAPPRMRIETHRAIFPAAHFCDNDGNRSRA